MPLGCGPFRSQGHHWQDLCWTANQCYIQDISPAVKVTLEGSHISSKMSMTDIIKHANECVVHNSLISSSYLSVVPLRKLFDVNISPLLTSSEPLDIVSCLDRL